MSRKRRRRKVGKHISLSATDADWETVRSNAKRRGLSIARYLVELVERDASEEDAGLRHECPELALAAEEQRELLEAVREVRALMLEGEDAGPLVRDMQERIAVMFAAWASAMAGSGRSEELCGRSPRCWARSGRASLRPRSWPRSRRLPRSGRRFRRRAKGRRTPARTGSCEAGAISAADLG